MPRTCTVCAHPDNHAVDLELVNRAPYRTVAHRYAVSTDALKRHLREHVPQVLVKGREAEEAARADDLLAELRSEKADIQRLKGLAEEEADYRAALLAVDKALKALELQARVAQLIDKPTEVNLLIAHNVQTAIVRALDPYPQARIAVADALAELEASEARERSLGERSLGERSLG